MALESSMVPALPTSQDSFVSAALRTEPQMCRGVSRLDVARSLLAFRWASSASSADLAGGSVECRWAPAASGVHARALERCAPRPARGLGPGARPRKVAMESQGLAGDSPVETKPKLRCRTLQIIDELLRFEDPSVGRRVNPHRPCGSIGHSRARGALRGGARVEYGSFDFLRLSFESGEQ